MNTTTLNPLGKGLRPLNILLIDDSRTARLVLKTQIEAMASDVSVHCVDPAKHGLPGKDYDWSKIDHLVINQNLGTNTGLANTGLEWYQHASTQNPLPSTTLISGTHTVTLESAARRAGMAGLITKNSMAASRLVEDIHATHRLQH